MKFQITIQTEVTTVDHHVIEAADIASASEIVRGLEASAAQEIQTRTTVHVRPHEDSAAMPQKIHHHLDELDKSVAAGAGFST